MVTRKPRHAIRFAAFAMALAGAMGVAHASESGVLSLRAQRSFDSGKFAKGYGQLERALLASRKEADLLSEGRILIGMAQIRTMSLDFAFADSLLSVVRPEALDKNTKVQLAKVQMALASAQENYKGAVKTCKSLEEDLVKAADESTRAAFYGECAIAHAGVRQGDDANNFLNLAGKNSNKKGGFYAFTAARIANILQDEVEADSLYKVAEQKSIQANKPYMTASILYYRAQLKGTPAKEKEDLRLRCKNAFELMGLPNNAKRCGE